MMKLLRPCNSFCLFILNLRHSKNSGLYSICPHPHDGVDGIFFLEKGDNFGA